MTSAMPAKRLGVSDSFKISTTEQAGKHRIRGGDRHDLRHGAVLQCIIKAVLANDAGETSADREQEAGTPGDRMPLRRGKKRKENRRHRPRHRASG